MFEFLDVWNFQDKNFELWKMVFNKSYEEYRGIENYKPVATEINFPVLVKKFSTDI